jgi:hypothetical protein
MPRQYSTRGEEAGVLQRGGRIALGIVALLVLLGTTGSFAATGDNSKEKAIESQV